jgi:hypothetical protein
MKHAKRLVLVSLCLLAIMPARATAGPIVDFDLGFGRGDRHDFADITRFDFDEALSFGRTQNLFAFVFAQPEMQSLLDGFEQYFEQQMSQSVQSHQNLAFLVMGLYNRPIIWEDRGRPWGGPGDRPYEPNGDPNSVPEPATLGLMATGIAAVMIVRRRRQ